MAEDRTVPLSAAGRMLMTGFEWEAGLFVETFRELESRYGRDVAKQVLGRAMYRAGLRLGQEARQLTETRDAKGMAEAWDVLYGMGSKEAGQLNSGRFVVHSAEGGCAAVNLMRRWGLEDDIRFLCDAYCCADVGHAEGFNEQMHFQHTARIVRGDDHCTWDFSMTPQEPSPSAVDVALFRDE